MRDRELHIKVGGMPSSAVRTFTDPDDYAASIRAGEVELTVTGRGQFAAKVARIEFCRLCVQWFSDSLPRTVLQQALFEKTWKLPDIERVE